MSATRAPLPPPFWVGERLRYLGQSRIVCDGVEVLAPGMVVTIDAVRFGRRGTGRELRIDDGLDDDLGPVVDTTTDGTSRYTIRFGSRDRGRLIRPRSANEWEPLDKVDADTFRTLRVDDRVRVLLPDASGYHRFVNGVVSDRTRGTINVTIAGRDGTVAMSAYSVRRSMRTGWIE